MRVFLRHMEIITGIAEMFAFFLARDGRTATQTEQGFLFSFSIFSLLPSSTIYGPAFCNPETGNNLLRER